MNCIDTFAFLALFQPVLVVRSGESCEGVIDMPIGYQRGEYAITIETQNAGVFVGNFYL